MATIFPLSASVNQEFNGYVFDGDSWNAVGSGFAIEHLSDVEISSILDGDSLIYNSASSKWINQIPDGSSVTISSRCSNLFTKNILSILAFRDPTRGSINVIW